MHFTRRDFLKASAACAVAATVNAQTPVSAGLKIGDCLELPTSATFPLGVASGDVTPQNAVLQTQHTSSRPLKIAVWPASANLCDPPYIYTDAVQKEGGFVHMDALRLKPFTAYRFAFVELNSALVPVGRSRVGRFKTAPSPDTLVPLTIGAVCCTHNDHEFSILEHAGTRTDIDFFMLLGDASYNDGCVSMPDFRKRWARNMSQKGYLDLRASTSVIATLDDHEVTDNFDPEVTPPALLAAAVRSFFDHMPVRSTGNNRLWRSFQWGRTCEVFVLDCRTERKPSTRHYAHEQYISRQQMEWLKAGLANSKAVFKVIMNSVPISSFPFPMESDRWEGYPKQRLEILSFIDNNRIPGILWVSGDFHFASVGRVSSQGPGRFQTEILAGPGAQFPNLLGTTLNTSSQFDWATARNNYATITFDPLKYKLDLHYMGGDQDPRMTRLEDIVEIHHQVLDLDVELPRCDYV